MVNIVIEQASTTPTWVVGAVGAGIGGSIALLSAKLSDRRKRKADDKRQWDKDIRDLYLDVNELMRQYDEIRLRPYIEDEAELQAPEKFFSESKRDRFRAENQAAREHLIPLAPELDRIVDRSKFFDVDHITQTITEMSEIIKTLINSTHDGLAYRKDTRRLTELRETLLQQTKKAAIRH